MAADIASDDNSKVSSTLENRQNIVNIHRTFKCLYKVVLPKHTCSNIESYIHVYCVARCAMKAESCE